VQGVGEMRLFKMRLSDACERVFSRVFGVKWQNVGDLHQTQHIEAQYVDKFKTRHCENDCFISRTKFVQAV